MGVYSSNRNYWLIADSLYIVNFKGFSSLTLFSGGPKCQRTRVRFSIVHIYWKAWLIAYWLQLVRLVVKEYEFLTREAPRRYFYAQGK